MQKGDIIRFKNDAELFFFESEDNGKCTIIKKGSFDTYSQYENDTKHPLWFRHRKKNVSIDKLIAIGTN
jgi:hypothetical protein